eukprot:scaffold15295_cov110-Skeletonema_marinoi.AAC.2
MDERVFSALAVSNEKWTAHAADEEFRSETEAEMRGTIEDMKVEITLQKAQITSQREELEILRSQQEELMLEKEEVGWQDKETRLRCLKKQCKNARGTGSSSSCII